MYKKLAAVLVCIVLISIISIAGFNKVNAGADNEITLDQALKQKQKLVIADFYVSWCGYCRRFSPILHNLQNEYKDKFIFVFVNCENPRNKKLIDEFYVPAYPTLYIINPVNGHKVLVDQYIYDDSSALKVEFNKFLSINSSSLNKGQKK